MFKLFEVPMHFFCPIKGIDESEKCRKRNVNEKVGQCNHVCRTDEGFQGGKECQRRNEGEEMKEQPRSEEERKQGARLPKVVHS